MNSALTEKGEWVNYIAHDPKPNSEEWLLDVEQRTENALAQRFIQLYGKDLLYVPRWRKWLVWDGKRFKIDNDSSAATLLARRFAGTLWRDFTHVAETQTEKKALDPLYAFCKQANRKRFVNLPKRK